MHVRVINAIKRIDKIIEVHYVFYLGKEAFRDNLGVQL